MIAVSQCYAAHLMQALHPMHANGSHRGRLSLAINGCPRGFHGDPTEECTCSTLVVQRDRARISGALLDRIDIQVEVPTVRYTELAERRCGVGVSLPGAKRVTQKGRRRWSVVRLG